MNLPSREECDGWDQAQVSLFMCKNNMQECAITVKRLKINGQRLLNLSESDMSKFSLIHQPQLQKIVQDIKKNDGSLLNKLRRLKSKPLPKVPARDYRDDDKGSDELSDPEYDNDMCEEQEDQEGSYEPPPSHRALPTTPSASVPRGSISEDYINPDCSNDDDNYIEPAEDPPANSRIFGGRAGRNQFLLPERPSSPDFYEVPDREESSESSPVNRSHSLLPKPSPRMNLRRSPAPVPEPTGEDEYEVCDPDESSCDRPVGGLAPRPPKCLPRERSPKPPQRPKPKQREFESQTLPMTQSEQKPPPKTFSLDMRRPKIPLPHFTYFKPTDKQISADNWPEDEDKDGDIYNKPWYASSCDRRTADNLLLHYNKDGAFMVRRSSGQDAQQPYTLVVFYRGRVYNIPIRFITNTQQYALGREKKGEEYFNSISHIIENHQKNPLVLIDGHSNTKDATRLCFPMRT